MEQFEGFNKQELKTSLSPEKFHLILFPTEQCNFRCVYCYEDFSIGKMPAWLVDATKTLLSRKIPNLKVLNLSWFGGEPLLAKRILLDISRHAYELCQQFGCKMAGDLTTNAALLDVETLTELVALEQKHFQISIDGDKDMHDTTRLTRRGEGSFDLVFGNLLAASKTELDFNITVRVHVTSVNQASVKRFCELYKKELAHDSRFKLFFKAIEDLGGDNQVDSLVTSEAPRKVAAELQQIYDPSDKGEQNYICYASKPNSLAIRANGVLAKCTVALQDDTNALGRINADGTLELNNDKFKSWIQGFFHLDAWRMGCPHSYMKAQKKPDVEFSKDIEIIEVA